LSSSWRIFFKPLVALPSEWIEVEAMPPNPYKLLKTSELTAEQKRDLDAKLRKRQQKLKAAMEAIEAAIGQLSSSLDQGNKKKYRKKIK
jgi:DNA primase